MSAPAEAPFLKRTPLDPALPPVGASAVGTEFSVDIRGRQARARVVEAPFYKRKKEVAA
jgi:glycine cleavage system aminomethyltransferase T